MNKFLSVIIPYYKETKDEIMPLLSSINAQVGINFDEIEVIMVNDGVQNKMSPSFIKMFKNLKIRAIMAEENRGPGVARQIGIDAANGTYVMFCDADDILHSVGVLGALISVAREGFDFISSMWMEEIKTPDGFNYINHGADLTWMHGKVIRRDFLIKNNIRFDEDLRVHEDSYFLAVCADACETSMHAEVFSYVWKWGDNTITRKNGGEYSFSSLSVFNEAISKSMDKSIEMGIEKNIAARSLQVLIYNYFIAHSQQWQTEETGVYLKSLESSVVKYFKKFIPYINTLPEEVAAEIYAQERNREQMRPIEAETLSMWMERIGLI